MSLSASPEVLDLCKQVVETAQPVIEAVTSVQVINSQILYYVACAFLAGWFIGTFFHVVTGLILDWLDAPKGASHD